jgi:hypothetical protein
MWVSALKTYENETTRYVFFPEELALRPLEQIRADLTKHKLALQPNTLRHMFYYSKIELREYHASNSYSSFSNLI